MKKNILIITFLTISLLAAFTAAHAQDSTQTLLADETTMSYSKTGAKIECDNESIAKIIHQKWGQLINRYTCTKKKDRHGEYKHYVFYLNKEDAQYIIKWSKSNL